MSAKQGCVDPLVRSKRLKSLNAFTAILCGGLPAAFSVSLFPGGPWRYFIGFVVGIVWADGFEYFYHRFLLHHSRSTLARHHMEHHAATGTAAEAEHINFGVSPLSVAELFLLNGGAAVLADVLFGLRIAPGVLAA